ncbi:hypothetical protein Tco_0401911 [Tanacetum coccineum]
MMEPTVSPDGSWHQNRVGASYMDNGSLMYLMSGYNPYGLQSFLGEGMSGCLWILNTPSRQSTSDLSELLQSPHLWSLNQVFLLGKLAVYGQEIRSHVFTFHHMGSC